MTDGKVEPCMEGAKRIGEELVLVRRIEGATGSQERHDNDATPHIAGGS
jgi:hypothetical protein